MGNILNLENKKDLQTENQIVWRPNVNEIKVPATYMKSVMPKLWKVWTLLRCGLLNIEQAFNNVLVVKKKLGGQ